MKNLAVIPARGGSKRIPKKNIKSFHGIPIIAHTIKMAQSSGIFDKIIVSTDDEEIARVACKFGAEVPFLRPDELSDDFTPTLPVITHAINFFAERRVIFNAVTCLYPTAPFVQDGDIKKASIILEENPDCAYIFPVTTFPFPIQRAIKIVDGKVRMFFPENFYTRSQDLEEAYQDAGQFYMARTNTWLEEKIFFSENSIPLLLPRFRVQDIDTPEDWKRAELMYNSLNQMSDKS